MNKKLMNALFVGFLILGSTNFLTSCKDYDDDINDLQSQIDEINNELSSQITSLQTALNTTQSEAEAAKSAAAAATQEAEEASALAQSAAAQAKAEAIEEALAQAKELLASGASAEDLSKLAGTVDGIQKGLNALSDKADEHVKAHEALDVQLNALNLFKTSMENNAATKDDIDDVKGQLIDINNQLDGLSTTEEIENKIKAANDIVTETLGNDISTLNGVIMRRLTSIAFVPEYYIDGIPTIEFKTLKYTPQVFNKLHAVNSDEPQNTGSTTLDVASASTLTLSGITYANYRLNPTGVTASDIDVPSYVSAQATNSTRGTTTDEPVSVVADQKLNIENGILKLQVTKNENINLSTPLTDGTQAGDVDGKFYIVSLKTPIAKANLVKDETEAYVYSEYVRVSEKTFEPFIEKSVESASSTVLTATDGSRTIKEGWETVAPATKNDQHYKDSVVLWNSNPKELVSWYIPYNKSVDLNTLVKACEYNPRDVEEQHSTFIPEDYGLRFVFGLPESYMSLGGPDDNTNQTDQQKFAKLEGSILSSKVYNVGSTSATATGREPIIRISLVDTRHNNALVCQRYMKIKWTKEATVVEPIELPAYNFSADYTCGNLTGKFGTQEMNEKVYDAVGRMLGNDGFTKAEFHNIYRTLEVVQNVSDPIAADVQEVRNTEEGVESYNIVWTLTHQEMGTIWEAANKTYTVKFKYVDPTGVNAPVVFTWNYKVTMPTLSISGHQEAYWVDRTWNVFKVNPFVYKTKNQNGDVISNPTCNIWTDLKNGFVKGNDKVVTLEEIVKDFNCDKVNIVFDESRLAAFATQYGYETASLSEDKKTLLINGNPAAIIGIDDIDAAKVPTNDWIYLTEVGNDYTSAAAEATPEGKKLVGKDVPVKIVADICGDNVNTKVVKSYQIHFIDPLKVNAQLEGDFEDAVISGSKIGLDEAFTFTDWNGYTVAEVTTGTTEKTKYAADLYVYYKVGTANWLTDQIKTNLKADANGNLVVTEGYKEGPLPSNVTINYDAATNELVYYNQIGTPVLNDYKVYIPVEVAHKWGVAKQTVEATVKVAAGSGN